MIDAVVLDWEGVLADTGAARRDALQRAETEMGHHANGEIDADPTLSDLIALRASRAFAERLGKGFSLAPGAREFIEGVVVHAPVAIVTSATRSETEFVLRLSGLEASVATIVSADDALDLESGDAHRDAVARLARKRPVSLQRVVALAHTAPALDGARRAGVRTIAVGAEAHVALHADGAVDDLGGLTVVDLARLAGIIAAEHPS